MSAVRTQDRSPTGKTAVHLRWVGMSGSRANNNRKEVAGSSGVSWIKDETHITCEDLAI